MSRKLMMSQKLEPLLLESQRPYQRKIKTEKIKRTIEAAITPTKVARATETQVTPLALRDQSYNKGTKTRPLYRMRRSITQFQQVLSCDLPGLLFDKRRGTEKIPKQYKNSQL